MAVKCSTVHHYMHLLKKTWQKKDQTEQFHLKSTVWILPDPIPYIGKGRVERKGYLMLYTCSSTR